MSKTLIVEVVAGTSSGAAREASTLAMLALAQKDKTIKVSSVSTRYLSAKRVGPKLMWTLECTLNVVNPKVGVIVPMPGRE